MSIKSVIRKLGFDVRRAGLGQDPYEDIAGLIRPDPVVFDAGANLGQTIDVVLQRFPRATVHAFEPGAAFDRLASTHKRPNVRLNNFALGAKPGRLTFHQQSASDMSSFLRPGADADYMGSTVSVSTDVDVSTIDNYCKSEHIERIDLLKSDTQGFDLEVLKGAEEMLDQGRVEVIYLEITFAQLYENIPRFDQIYGFIVDHGFDLVSFYKMWHIKGRAGWTDALFVKTIEPL